MRDIPCASHCGVLKRDHSGHKKQDKTSNALTVPSTHGKGLFKVNQTWTHGPDINGVKFVLRLVYICIRRRTDPSLRHRLVIRYEKPLVLTFSWPVNIFVLIFSWPVYFTRNSVFTARHNSYGWEKSVTSYTHIYPSLIYGDTFWETRRCANVIKCTHTKPR